MKGKATRYREAYDACLCSLTEEVLRSANEYLTDGPFRDFMTWGLQPHTTRYESFIRVTALHQIAQWMALLLADVDNNSGTVLKRFSLIGTWLAHEFVSDNLAIGLGHPMRLDCHHHSIQRSLLQEFNNLMISRVQQHLTSRELMDSLFSLPWESISLPDLTHSPLPYRTLLQHFCRVTGASEQLVARDAHRQLYANVETCVAALNLIDSARLDNMIRASLISRYGGINELLFTENPSFGRLLDIGTHTILVVPVLGMLAAALAQTPAEKISLATVLEDGVLQVALEEAALSVRFYNDVGPQLLRMNCAERDELFARLFSAMESEALLSEHLRTQASEYPALNRILKDLTLDEENVVLHGIAYQRGHETALVMRQRIEQSIMTFSSLTTSLKRNLKILRKADHGTKIFRLVFQFLMFYERLYGSPYSREDPAHAA